MGLNGPEWKGPKPHLLFNVSEPFVRLQIDLHLTLNVYIRLHQFAYVSFQEHDKLLDKIASKIKAENLAEPKNLEEREALQLMKSRSMDWILTEDYDLTRSIQTINRMMVVTLWALAEQYLGKVLRKLVSLRTGDPVEPVTNHYKFDKFRLTYKSEGIVLDTLHDYAIANECRVLNNHIKHSDVVSDKLAAFPPFSAFLGESLDQVVIDPQRYLNGVSNFLGGLIGHANSLYHAND